MSFLSGVVDFLSSDSILSSVVKIVGLAFVASKVASNTQPQNSTVDLGVRQQLGANVENKIPVIYGAAYQSPIVTDAVMTNTNQTMWYALTLSETTGNLLSTGGPSVYTFKDIYWNNNKVSFQDDGITISYIIDPDGNIDTSMNGLIQIYCYAGNSNNQIIPQPYINAATTSAYSLIPGWTSSTNMMSNLLFAVVKLTYNKTNNVTALGTFKFHIDNSMKLPGDVLYDYMTNTSTYGAGISSTDIVQTSLSDLNTFSAQSVAYNANTLNLLNRYQINGVLDTTKNVMANLDEIATAAGSWITYDTHQGQWGVIINTTGTSLASFNDGNMIGNVGLGGTSLKDLYNSIKVSFPNKALLDSVDYVQIDTLLANRNPNESENTLNVSYSLIDEPIQAQMLAELTLAQTRLDKIITFQSDYAYVGLKAGDIIDVTNTRYGFSSKLFRIISIVELQDDTNALKVEITALEYDSTIYNFSNLSKYIIQTSTGIQTIGNIGQPGKPLIDNTTFNTNAQPKVIITSLSPTGIVDGMEFWISGDASIPNDSERNYYLAGTVNPPRNYYTDSITIVNTSGTTSTQVVTISTGSGNVFPIGTAVEFQANNLNSGNFVVKTRGTNGTTAGSFSTPSSFHWTPTQTTDAISNLTKILGQAALGFGAAYLLNQLGGLITGNTGSGSLIGSILNSITSATGISLSGGSIPTTPLSIYDEGNIVNNKTTKINFQGDGVVATQAGDVINVIIGNSGGTTATSNIGLILVTSITPNHGPQSGGTNVSIIGAGFETYTATSVTFGGVKATNVVRQDDTLITATSPHHAGGTVSVNVLNSSTGAINIDNEFFTYDTIGYLNAVAKYPNSYGNGFQVDEVPGDANNPDLAPVSGSYFLKFTGPTFYGALQAGTGNATLYKSNGTQIQQLSANSLIYHNNVVEFPFSTREYGTDYYILIDEGAITYCTTWINAEFDEFSWCFSTPNYATTVFNIAGDNLSVYSGTSLYVTGYSPSGSNVGAPDKLSITFNQTIHQSTGLVKLYDSYDNQIAVFNASDGTVSNKTLTFTGLSSLLNSNTTYYITVEQGVAFSTYNVDCHTSGTIVNSAVTDKSLTFSTSVAFSLTGWHVESGPVYSNLSDGGSTDPDYVKVNPQTYIKLYFNRTPVISNGTITLYQAGGGTHQEFKYPPANGHEANIYKVNSGVVTLNPTKDLTPGATYYINATQGSIRDSSNTPWQGLTDSTTIRFTVDPGPNVTVNPITNTTSTIHMSFDRPVAPGPGNIEIVDPLGNVVGSFPSTNDSTTYSSYA